jgi:DDE family transposase
VHIEGRRAASFSTWIRASALTHGEQEMSVWHGHYDCTCYHPLFVFNQLADLERYALRAANVHNADGCTAAKMRSGRSSSGIAAGSGASACQNQVLLNRIAYLLKRPVGRRPTRRRYYASFSYQAASWSKPRRVVAKIELHPASASS